MPFFLENKLLFIHIPKTGGTSIEQLLEDSGEEMGFYTFRGEIFINGHTPQHCSYEELEKLNMVNTIFKIFTVVRDPVDRVISEYFYIQKFRPDISRYFKDFNEFINLFLNYDNLILFDNHNLSQFDYLKNSKGEIPDCIKIFQFFDIIAIEKYLGLKGLKNYTKYTTDKGNFQLNLKQKNRIKEFYFNDYKLLNIKKNNV